jgi:hypothetical protein
MGRADDLPIGLGKPIALQVPEQALKLCDVLGLVGKCCLMFGDRFYKAVQIPSGKAGFLFGLRWRVGAADDRLDGGNGQPRDEGQFQVERSGQFNEAGQSEVHGPFSILEI